ncbi:hypothetical protein EJB05_42913, partial [Eragrostis curvula]
MVNEWLKAAPHPYRGKDADHLLAPDAAEDDLEERHMLYAPALQQSRGDEEITSLSNSSMPEHTHAGAK